MIDELLCQSRKHLPEGWMIKAHPVDKWSNDSKVKRVIEDIGGCEWNSVKHAKRIDGPSVPKVQITLDSFGLKKQWVFEGFTSPLLFLGVVNHAIRRVQTPKGVPKPQCISSF